MLLRQSLAEPRDPQKCNVGPRASAFRSRDPRKRNTLFFEEDPLMAFKIIYLLQSYKQFFVILDNRKTLVRLLISLIIYII